MENPEYSDLNDDESPALDDTPQPSLAAMESSPPSPHASPRAGLPQKSPILAAFLSFLPGLGNIYNGLYRRAIHFFLVFVALFFLTVTNENEAYIALLAPCMVFVWFFNVFDAYRQTILINYGYQAEVDEARISMKGWGLTPGIFLVAVGVYGLLDQYLDISLDLIFDHWPILLILGGVGLIVQHFRERQARAEEI